MLKNIQQRLFQLAVLAAVFMGAQDTAFAQARSRCALIPGAPVVTVSRTEANCNRNAAEAAAEAVAEDDWHETSDCANVFSGPFAMSCNTLCGLSGMVWKRTGTSYWHNQDGFCAHGDYNESGERTGPRQCGLFNPRKYHATYEIDARCGCSCVAP